MKQKLSTLLIVVFGIAALLLPSFHYLTAAESSAELNQQIQDKQKRVEELKRQAAAYESKLAEKRKERVTLTTQVSLISQKIEQTEIEVEATKTNIEAVTLEIRELENNIELAEKTLSDYRNQLSDAVRWYARTQNRDVIYVFFSRPSFTAFYDELRSARTVQRSVSTLVAEVDTLKNNLEQQHTKSEQKRLDLETAVDQLDNQQLSLEAQQETKNYLLEQTKSSEQRFAALLADAKREADKANSEIATLEKAARERLKQEGIPTNAERPGLIWPVPNSRGISAIFHDPDYPFRKAFEHSGLDIRAYQGTPIRAAASGYVAIAKTGGATGYGYVMIVHSGGLATVYGHVSKIVAKTDSFVAQGDIIAYSGGMPGTPGAGPFSTGPHLHFETRLNGIPVNPRSYLP